MISKRIGIVTIALGRVVVHPMLLLHVLDAYERQCIQLLTVGQNMACPLPTELAKLPYLQTITLYINELTETMIPEVYTSIMRHLFSLELQ